MKIPTTNPEIEHFVRVVRTVCPLLKRSDYDLSEADIQQRAELLAELHELDGATLLSLLMRPYVSSLVRGVF